MRPPGASLQLIIFDCDGVLVDSEVISNDVLARMLTAEGLPTTLAEARRAYQGLLLSEWREENKRNKRFYRLSSQGELILQKLLDELKTINASLERIVQEA